MVAGAALVPPIGVLPTVVSPLGVVPKPYSDKKHLILNIRFVNEHLDKRRFMFEGLSNIADMAEKGDYPVALFSHTYRYCHVALYHSSRRFVSFELKNKYNQYNCIPAELSTAP